MAAAIALRLSSLDALRVARGHCLSCEWCPRFLSPSKRILCDYCGCPPAKHQRLDNDNQKGNSSGSGSKKIKLTDKASSSGTPSSEDDDEEEDDLDAGAEMDARPPSPPSTEEEDVETVKAVKAPRGRKKRLASADG